MIYKLQRVWCCRQDNINIVFLWDSHFCLDLSSYVSSSMYCQWSEDCCNLRHWEQRTEDKGESMIRIVSAGLCAGDFLIKMSAYNPDYLWPTNKIILWDFLFSVSFLWLPSCFRSITLRKLVDDEHFKTWICSAATIEL